MCIYCELHVVGLLVYVIVQCYFVCWLVLFGRANNNHPSPSPIHPLLFGLYSSFSHRDKNGYDFWTISEASLTPICTIAFISRSSFFAPCSTYKLPLQTKPSSFQIIYSLISRPMQIISAVPNMNSSSLTHNEKHWKASRMSFSMQE
jgi:hypothetical protein